MNRQGVAMVRSAGQRQANAPRMTGPGADPDLHLHDRDGRPRSIAVLSSKGGAGKSSLVANLGVTMAEMGERVLLLDGDWGLGNLDMLLGLEAHRTLHDVLHGHRRPAEILLRGPAGVRVLPGASGSEELANLDDFRCETLLRSVRGLVAGDELLLIDTGPGLLRQSLRLAQGADEILVLTTPEPTACANACALLRALAERRLARPPRLIVNRARTAAEARATERRIHRCSAPELGYAPDVVGVIPSDDVVTRALWEQRPFVLIDPEAPASRAVRSLAQRLLSEAPSPEAPELSVARDPRATAAARAA